MEIYYIGLILLVVLSLIESGNKISKLTFLFIIVLFTFFTGVRYGVGNDYAEYYIHHSLIKGGQSNYFEPLFSLMNYLTPNPEVMFFLAALISYVLLYKSFKYFFPDNGILIFTLYYGIYLVIFDIHIIRQGIAIAIVLYSWKFVMEKKPAKFFLMVVLAMGFHTSAIVTFPIYFLRNKIFSLKLKILLLILSVIFLINFVVFKEQIFSLLAFIPLFERYATVYLDPEFSSTEFLSFGFVLNLAVFFIMTFYIKYRNPKFDSEKIMLIENIFFVSILGSLILRFSEIALRMNYYYQISNIFMFIILIYSFKEKNVLKAIFLAISALYLYVNLNTGYAILDYRTIFSK